MGGESKWLKLLGGGVGIKRRMLAFVLRRKNERREMNECIRSDAGRDYSPQRGVQEFTKKGLTAALDKERRRVKRSEEGRRRKKEGKE